MITRTLLAAAAAALALASPAAAGPAAPGSRLVETGSARPAPGRPAVRRLACSARFCLWQVREVPAPGCTGAACRETRLLAADPAGRALGGSAAGQEDEAARFLDETKVEVLAPDALVRSEAGSGGRPWDPGFESALLRRRVLRVEADGRRLADDGSGVRGRWASPDHYSRLERVLELGAAREPASVALPLLESVIDRARLLCVPRGPAPGEAEVRHHGCRGPTCLLLLGSREPGAEFLCALLAQGESLQPIALKGLVRASAVHGRGPRWCLVDEAGRVRGAGDEACLRKDDPRRMGFVETGDVHLEQGLRYPVRAAVDAAGARALAPHVHADTVWHLQQDAAAWRGEHDLALVWQAGRVGDELVVHVEADDDAVVPAGAGKAAGSDRLELVLARRGARGRPGASLRLAALLEDGGRVRTRLWSRKGRDVDEPHAAEGAWTQSARGWSADLRLPLAPLRKALEAERDLDYELTVADADKDGRRGARIGSQGELMFWDEYPPSIEEYVRAYPF